MDIRQLQMLLAVVEAGSYAKAGERLWVTHSAVHRQIRLLEEEVKDRILVKSGRKMELTDTGKILLDLARRVTNEVSQTERRIASRNQKLSGSFRIGTSTTTLTFFLPPVLLQFRSLHPDVDLHILTGTAERVADAVRMRHLDIGIMMGSKHLANGERNLLRHFLYQEEFVLAVHKEHRLAREHTNGAVSLQQLRDCIFIMHARSSHIRRMIDQLCEEADLIPSVGMELENEETMELMVAINMGIAFLSKRRIKQQEDIVYLQIQERKIATDVALIYGDDEFHPLVFREFLKLCHVHASSLQSDLVPA